jgi:hypothetical protein
MSLEVVIHRYKFHHGSLGPLLLKNWQNLETVRRWFGRMRYWLLGVLQSYDSKIIGTLYIRNKGTSYWSNGKI